MPKFIVGLVAAAFAFVIGFACGALLTAPKNTRMESLVNENIVFKKNVADFESKVLLLQNDVNSLKEINEQLKDQLLQAYMKKEKASSSSKQARITAAHIDIANLEVALDAFEIDTGRYPTSSEGLGALVQEPNNVTNWRGPYIKRGNPTDPWGNAYIYKQPGQYNQYGYDIYSYGPDGQQGGDDDIDNWSG